MEDIRVCSIVVGMGAGIRLQRGERHSIVGRNLYGKAATVCTVGIVESEEAFFRRQFNYRSIDECATAYHIRVIHTEHLIATITVCTPNVFRIRANGCGGGSGVVPAARNGIGSHAFKVLRPREGGDVVAGFLLHSDIVQIEVCIAIGIVGSSLEDDDHLLASVSAEVEGDDLRPILHLCKTSGECRFVSFAAVGGDIDGVVAASGVLVPELQLHGRMGRQADRNCFQEIGIAIGIAE